MNVSILSLKIVGPFQGTLACYRPTLSFYQKCSVIEAKNALISFSAGGKSGLTLRPGPRWELTTLPDPLVGWGEGGPFPISLPTRLRAANIDATVE